MRNKRIAVIGLKGLPAFGGAATVGENIIEQLKEKYDFTVYSVESHTKLKTGQQDGFYQIVFRSFSNKKLNTLFYYIRSMLHAIIIGNYDLVHLHHRDASFIIPVLRLKYKLILTTHGTQLNEISKWEKLSWFFNAQLRYFARFANRIIAVSKTDQRNLKIIYNLESRYIPNGVPLGVKILEPDYNGYIFFSAGRIMYSKGAHLLLEALNEIGYKGKVLIAGSMDHESLYSEYLIKFSKKLDITFLGLIKDKSILLGFLKNSRIFVFPTFNESMSMMLLEAVSVKVPIIASDIMPNKDIFNPKEMVFFENKSLSDLIKKLNWALKNSKAIERMALNAYRRAVKVYNWNAIGICYSKEYDLLLKK
jgi:glycosyltransferase involved in cell wall biosynthesis